MNRNCSGGFEVGGPLGEVFWLDKMVTSNGFHGLAGEPSPLLLDPSTPPRRRLIARPARTRPLLLHSSSALNMIARC